MLINGSRAHLQHAQARYSNLVPILIDVDHEILAQRLQARGRESITQIEQRLARNQQLKPLASNMFILHNNTSLSEAGHGLVDFLHQHMYREPQ